MEGDLEALGLGGCSARSAAVSESPVAVAGPVAGAALPTTGGGAEAAAGAEVDAALRRCGVGGRPALTAT